jgi:hypothetical protein
MCSQVEAVWRCAPCVCPSSCISNFLSVCVDTNHRASERLLLLLLLALRLRAC